MMRTNQALVPIEHTGRELAFPREFEEDTNSAWSSVGSRGRTGLMLILLFLGGFGWWATRVPLAGGAVAKEKQPNILFKWGSRKTMQSWDTCT